MTQANSNNRLASHSVRPSVVVAGLHLSGANARKSAVVLLECDSDRISFLSLYEKIGSVGSLFSDERILNILLSQDRVVDVMVDCPVTEPPCVACDRPTCPGVVRCDDVSVAMMMSIDSQRKRKGAKKLRPINPQNQRLWDVMMGRGAQPKNVEPTYSANVAPLVVRARTLQRRLRSHSPSLQLSETNVPLLLALLEERYQESTWADGYRNFERGRSVRGGILQLLRAANSGPLDLRVGLDDADLQKVAGTVETFHAFMSAAMAAWKWRGLAQHTPEYFQESSGWVHLLR